MTKFLLLYSGGSMPEESEMPEVLKDWDAWYSSLGEAVVDPGNPINQSKTISSDGLVSDGPNGTNATGYTIIEAGSLDDAAGMAKSCPVLKGGSDISIFETFPVM